MTRAELANMRALLIEEARRILADTGEREAVDAQAELIGRATHFDENLPALIADVRKDILI